MGSALSICGFLHSLSLYCGGLQSDRIQNIRKTCILKGYNLQLSSSQNWLICFILVVYAFSYTFKFMLYNILRFIAKALPLIKTAGSGLLFRVTV